MVFIKKLTGS